jgi:hypothetical protein
MAVSAAPPPGGRAPASTSGAAAALRSHRERRAIDGRETIDCEIILVERADHARCASHATGECEKINIEPLTESLRRPRRQSEFEESMRVPGGMRVRRDRQLCQLAESLQEYLIAVGAIADTSKRRHRRVDALSFHDLATGQNEIWKS